MRILVVEDNALLREAVSERLRRDGFAVDEDSAAGPKISHNQGIRTHANQTGGKHVNARPSDSTNRQTSARKTCKHV